MALPASDTTHLVRRSTSQPSQAESDMIMEESPEDMMQQDEDSLDSEEDGLRQLLLLQQTKY